MNDVLNTVTFILLSTFDFGMIRLSQTKTPLIIRNSISQEKMGIPLLWIFSSLWSEGGLANWTNSLTEKSPAKS